MRDENAIVRERQLAIRRELDRRGLSLKAVAFDSGLPYSSVLSYFPGEKDKEPHTISGAAIYALCAGKALPADLLSMLLPNGCMIVWTPEGIDHDAIGQWAEEYCNRKLAAHRADSEMEERIGPNERASLNATVASFPARAA